MFSRALPGIKTPYKHKLRLVRLLVMRLEAGVGGMLALLIKLEDINLSSRRKKLWLRHPPFLAKVPVANFLSYV